MLPVIQLPYGVTVHSYVATLVLATAVCAFLAPLWARRLEGISAPTTLRALGVLGVAAFAGARLHHVLANWPFFAGAPLTILRFWSGLHAPGAILATVLAAPAVFRRFDLPAGRFSDALVPTIGVGIAVGRIGCFLNGCCYGTPCDWPWCTTFPVVSAVTRVHPLQLYFAGAGLLITALGIWRHDHKRYDGEPALLALLLFSASSAIFELLRAEAERRVYWGPLPQLEWVTLAMTAGAIAALVVAETRRPFLVRSGASVRS